MRHFYLTVILVFLASVGYAQDARVSISMKSSTIDSVLDRIESQTDYLFIYRKGVNVMARRSIDVSNKPTYEVLNTLFAGTDIIYTMEGNYIVLNQVRPAIKIKTVTGIVTDNDGIPLGGVVVHARRSRAYSMTDNLGQFSIDLEDKDDLQFSCLGYESSSTQVIPGQHLNVELEEKFETMPEVVAIGFGIQKKSDVTGSITSIDRLSFENRSVNNLSGSLAGIAAGIQVISTSGDPDAVGDIRIRGLASNSSSANSPLYVVDGLLMKSIEQINPLNVENIEIFKDAASAAIYGAQAGNGVVVITTKTGSAGSGKIFYNGSYSFESLGWKPKMMNSRQYADFMVTSGVQTPGVIEENWDGRTDTDWVKEMFPGGYAAKHNFGMEGGNDKANYYTSFSYLDNDGILYGDKDRMRRVNLQFNASYKVKDWARMGTTNTIQYKKTSAEIGSMGGDDKSLMALIYGMSPLVPLSYSKEDMPDYMRSYLDKGYPLIQLPGGEYISTPTISSAIINPLSRLYRYPGSTEENMDIYGTVFADINPIKPVKFTSRFGYIIENKYTSKYEEPWYVGEQEYNTEHVLSATLKWKFRYQWDNFVNAKFILGGKHDLDLMAGMSYMEYNGRQVSGSTNELKDYRPNFRYLDFSTTSAIDVVGGHLSKEASLSYFSRASYNYDNRYFLQMLFRADAFDTSRLSRFNRWGYFPSISAGWNITNEPWMDIVDKSELSFLKLRASWGINGNVQVLSDYPYATTVTVGGSEYALDSSGALTQASFPSRLANDKLKWEESWQVDVGLDARFFSSRLALTFDYYDKWNRDLLVSVTPSYTTGQSSVYMNAGTVRNTGVELEIGWKDSIGDLFYSISSNISHNRNLVTDLAPSITRIGGADVNNGHKCTYFQKGYPIWYMYGYVFEGVEPETGNGIYKDLDGDGKVTTSDMTMIGSAQPDFTYGLSVSAEYRNLDFSISANGSQGNDIWYSIRTNHLKNMPEVFYSGAWRHPGDQTEYPRFSQILTSSYDRSSACVYDGSYLRISTIQFGYSLPSKIVNAIKAEKVRLYISMDDYFTISRYIGFDPVTAGDNASSGLGIDRGTYPSPRKITLGVNISL